MEIIPKIILLIINLIIYFIICGVLYRRKAFTCISIRSPKLLILNIFGNFCMSEIVILTSFLSDNQKRICSFFYYITNFLIIIPFCLRFRRIIKCCEIKSQKFDLQESNTDKYITQEKLNLKIMLVIFVILCGILIAANLIVTREEFITAIFLYKGTKKLIFENANCFIWLGVNFIEHMILLSFVYKICINQLKQKLRFEIISCFVIWFLYSNLMTICINMILIDNETCVYISLAVGYLYLIINGIIPLVMSYSYRYSTSYSFNPKLMNNFYLFLSNEICYNKFKSYLIINNQNLLSALQLYIAIMNFKLGKKLNLDNEQLLSDAQEINLEFFSNNNNKANIPKNIFDKIIKDWNIVNKNNMNEDFCEIFDEALKYCYTELKKAFGEYKNTWEFKELFNKFFVTTIIQCKMCNNGLINKF